MIDSAARESLLTFVELRIQNPVLEAIRATVESTTDLGKLDRWFDVASGFSSLTDLQNAKRASS